MNSLSFMAADQRKVQKHQFGPYVMSFLSHVIFSVKISIHWSNFIQFSPFNQKVTVISSFLPNLDELASIEIL